MPVLKCSNGKWRIGSGSCIYDTKEKATKAYQAILASGKFAVDRVSLDYDGVLSTDKGKEKAKQLISEGVTVYVVSARRDKESMLGVAKTLGIPQSRVYATGSNKAKVQKIKDLNINTHYDDNPDVLDELKSINIKGLKL